MANGPFGNPLSTGIALSFEVDMTPYRQMHARKMANIEEKKNQRKKQQAELQNILKNVTVDTSKVHERYKDDAMNEYAATINDVMSSFKSGNVAGTYQRINKFNNQINSYVNATQDFNNYVKSKGDNTFRNEELKRAMNNVEGVSDDQLMEMFQRDIDYSNGLFNFTVIDRPDVMGNANKVLQGTEKMFMTDDAGDYIRTGKVGPRNKELYRTSIKDPDKFFEGQANLLKNSAGGNRLLMEYGGIAPAQLDERDASGRQLRDVLADKYVRELLSPKVYGEKGLDPTIPRVDKSDYTRPGVVGKVQIAEATPSPISREAFNFESYKKGAVPFIETEIAKIIEQNPGNDAAIAAAIEKKTGPTGEVKDANDFFGPNIISVRGTEVNIDKPTEAAKQIADALSQIDEIDFKSISGNFGYSEPTPTEVVKDFEKTATVNVFGRDIRKTFKIPKGEVYIVGSKGSKKVKILNAVDVPNSTFRTVNRDKQSDIWHGIDFPVEEESAIKQVLNEALGKDVLDDFVKSNGLPKTFIVPEVDENIQTLQTLDKELTPDFLDAELKRIGVYGSGTTSSASTESTGDGGSKYDKYKR